MGEERCIKTFMPIVEDMAKDSVFYVRKEAASAIGSIATVVNQAYVIEKLVSRLLALVGFMYNIIL
jgi:serine/threonine-protein phosphatase 4 regulatory subunit 1